MASPKDSSFRWDLAWDSQQALTSFRVYCYPAKDDRMQQRKQHTLAAAVAASAVARAAASRQKLAEGVVSVLEPDTKTSRNSTK